MIAFEWETMSSVGIQMRTMVRYVHNCMWLWDNMGQKPVHALYLTLKSPVQLVAIVAAIIRVFR